MHSMLPNKVHYKYKAQYKIMGVAEGLPNARLQNSACNNNDYKTVDYSRITPLLIQTCKEQQSLIENQQTQIDDLQKKIDQYKNDVDSLKIESPLFSKYNKRALMSAVKGDES